MNSLPLGHSTFTSNRTAFSFSDIGSSNNPSGCNKETTLLSLKSESTHDLTTSVDFKSKKICSLSEDATVFLYSQYGVHFSITSSYRLSVILPT